MTENNELIPILECSQPAVISENLIDLSARLLTITETVKNLPREQASLPEVKRLRAEMRKYFNALETQRKQVKADVLAPYEQANAVYQDRVAAPIEKTDRLCKDFIVEVETVVKKKCEDGLRDYFRELCAMHGLLWLRFESCGVKVDMAMANLKEPKKAKEQIRAHVESVSQTCNMISTMEYAGEILNEYANSLDLTQAISMVQDRHKAIEEMNRAREAKAMADAERRGNTAALLAEAPELASAVQPLEKKFKIIFAVTASMPRLRGLKAFLEGNHYEYQEVTDNG